MSIDNINLIKKRLEKEDWYDIYEEADIEDNFKRFTGVLQYHIHFISPLQTKTINPKKTHPFHMTEDLQKLKEQTITAKDTYIATVSIMAKNNYAALKKSYVMVKHNIMHRW